MRYLPAVNPYPQSLSKLPADALRRLDEQLASFDLFDTAKIMLPNSYLEFEPDCQAHRENLEKLVENLKTDTGRVYLLVDGDGGKTYLVNTGRRFAFPSKGQSVSLEELLLMWPECREAAWEGSAADLLEELLYSDATKDFMAGHNPGNIGKELARLATRKRTVNGTTLWTIDHTGLQYPGLTNPNKTPKI